MKAGIVLILSLVLAMSDSWAQFPPPPGEAGTTAMYKDSSAFVAWATSCELERGYMNIAEPDSGYAGAGSAAEALGKAGDNGTVSLGDGGTATLSFGTVIFNGSGPDFAVFENGFSDEFLELAFVEVSSNGVDFVRFPSRSLTDINSQVETFDSLDTRLINNLAGKYRALYGTPFDLEELSADPLLDVDAVKFIRIVDVVGSIDDPYCSFDSQGNKVNDPWPTPFPTSGFDLDAVGLIHALPAGVKSESRTAIIAEVTPHPVESGSIFRINSPFRMQFNLSIFSADGRLVMKKSKIQSQSPYKMATWGLGPGCYFMVLESKGHILTKKIIVGNAY